MFSLTASFCRDLWREQYGHKGHMLAHSDVIAGRPREAQPEELCSIMAHYRDEQVRSSVCVRMCVYE